MGRREPTRAASRHHMQRLPTILVAGVLTTVAVSQFALAAHPHVPPPPPASLGTIVNEKLPPTPLVDAQGRPTSLAALRGKTVVLADFMTSCQEECPITTGALEQLRREVDRTNLASRVVLVELTIDPQRDTPARLRAFTARTRVGVTLLTGRAKDLAALWRFLGIYVKQVPQSQPPNTDWLTGRPYTYDVQHQDGVFFLSSDGRERFVIAGPANVHGALDPKLAGLLDPLGWQNLHTPAPEAWTVADLAGIVHWLTGTPLPRQPEAR